MAENEILVKALKDLPYRIQTASLNQRKEIVENVINVLPNAGITDTIIKGICKIIPVTLYKYNDNASRHLINSLLTELTKTHPEWTLKHMSAVLLDVTNNFKTLFATSNTAQLALNALNWTCILLKCASKRADLPAYIKTLVELQSVLYTAVLAAGNPKKSDKGYRMLVKSWMGVADFGGYVAALMGLGPTSCVAVLGAAVVRYTVEKGRPESFADLKALLLDVFIKSLVTNKVKPLKAVIVACYPLLNQVTHAEFKATLLPALQKAMLRNPEIIIECVGLVMKGLKLDLSQYELGLGKSLISNLHAKDDQLRLEAADALKNLSMQCSDPEAIEKLLKNVFDVFNGSDGKITVVDHKISILQGAGNLSWNAVSGSSLQKLALTASEHFIKVLTSEVHEKTLCHTIEMLSLWCEKFTAEIPPKVVDAFKNGLTLKTSTSAIRTSYIQCLSTSLPHHSPLPQTPTFAPLLPILLKTVERAAQQSTQAAIVAEGLAAVCLLIRGAQAGEAEASGAIWNVLIDMDRQVFVSEKFLAVASESALVNVMHLCDQLLSLRSDKLNGKSSPIHRAILYCLTSPSHAVRQKCFPIVRKLVSASGGASVARSLLKELLKFTDSKTPSENDHSESSEISSQILVECVSEFCSGVDLPLVEIEFVALDALLPAHHPAIVKTTPHLWNKVARRFKLNPPRFLEKYSKQIKRILVDEYNSSSCAEHALATIAAINPEVLIPQMVATILKALTSPKMLHVSKDDYFTYLTPEDELYDKSVIPGSDENTLNAMNMKRESKAYSYKEQLEEQQLRRELEEKKRREGKIKEPQYTPKQLEVIKAQRDKENAIRNRLTELNATLLKCTSLITAASRGNPDELSFHYRELLPVLLELARSPLAAPHITKLFVDLRRTVFDQNLSVLSELIAYVTLRTLEPQCDLERRWEDEALNKAVKRTITKIHKLTVKSKDPEISDSVPQQHFTAPAMCYAFPLLSACVTAKNVLADENFVHDGLQIISEHAKLRGHAAAGRKDKYHPMYLPRRQMLSLLIELINSTTGRIQSQAEACLLEVSSSGSGQDGCATATPDEISVLLSALQNPSEVVRDSALRGLTAMVKSIPRPDRDLEQHLSIAKRIWIAKYDVVEENRQLANTLWTEAALTFPPDETKLLLKDVEHPVECIQQSTAQALAALLENQPKLVDEILGRLLKLYKSRLEMIPSKQDEFGRVIEQPIDMWSPRRGVALALTQLAPLLSDECVGTLVMFFVKTALGDRSEGVRTEMLGAALAVVDLHGKETVGTLLPVFEQFMDKAPKSGNFDAVRQAVVILMGSLARHLAKDDQRIKPIVTRLISALSTPSQPVQEAVANCLPHLVPSVREDAPALITKLLNQLLKSEKYGDRRGAAYGLAGLVKGMGILALKQLDIMTKLTEAIQDKKNYRHREGALFAFEMLCQYLGRLFEPYIVHVLPHLLLCFGDSSQYVRNATDDTSKVVMSKLSAHGVKLVLPSLLAALEEDSWRTKTGSVELLGAMAYCAPKQLSSCLPSIVPKLIEVLSDSHMKVQEAGAEALRVIGSVIRNPEIQAIVPVLLQALQDPSNKTSVCLQTLLDTQFVHFIDAPSLALIMPVVQRAFMDRSTETRKMAAQIIGNMYSLTDQKDLMPYLPTIIPGLKTSLLDPVPEVRSVSARALGAMVRGMGETSFEDLLPWLMHTLTSETSSVDRSGAAQGLSEVVGGLGVEKLHKLMPEIISTAERTDIAPHVKDGYIMMFIYMPVVFTAEFTPYIGQIINPILKALADENEYVRDTALKAGQRIVNLYADTAIMLLLPELERGLFDDNWRIRYSSVQLLGDLLYRISGVTGKMSTETASEDDNFGTEQSHTAIIGALGADRRNRVLAGLYMGRSDVALMVRQAALHVWKVVVTNTPRTLREILPTLFGLLLGCLASTSYDKRQVAARTLGDLVRKLGERVLPEIIPILERGLQSEQADQRQGVCIGLSEIMASTSKEMVLTFVNSLVPTVRKALCDPLPEVRQAAAKTFDSLHSTVGVRALDDILPAMLNQLNDADADVAECTLDGLRQVMAIKSRVVLPYLVPQLTAPPVNTKALSILASVAGEALNKYLHKILPALLSALSDSQGTPNEAQQLEYCQAVVLSVTDDAGIRTIMDQLLGYTKSESVERRRAAATLLCAFCASARADYSAHVPQLFRGLIHLCGDEDRDVLQMSWEALNAITKTLDPKQHPLYVSDIRQAVRYAISDLKPPSALLPGFCLPKGISPILPVFREAILNGDGEEKEAAAQGLGEVIRVTNAQALQPSVVAITGPLIRILGDRFSASVKVAVLETLAILLAKVGVMLKQFLPQLQTTFLKSLNDPNRSVHLKAAAALSHLIVIHVRADPLFSELHSSLRATDDSSVRETMLHALRGVVSAGGDKMSPAIRKQLHATLVGMLGHPEDVTRGAAAGCLGALCRWLDEEQLDATLSDYLLCDDPQDDWMLRHGRSAAIFVALKEAPSVLWAEEHQLKLIKTILSLLAADRIPVAMNAVRACGYLLQYLMMENLPLPPNLLVPFVRTMNHSSNEVKQLLARVCTHLGRSVPADKMAPELLKLLLPMLVNGTKEKNSYVKANSEIALINVLRLREGDETQKRCLSILEAGARESLSDVMSKVLRKVMWQADTKEEDLDDTFIT